MKRFAFVVAGIALLSFLPGCGGNFHYGTKPCEGSITGGSFSVSYGERSKTALSSALSGKLVIANGASEGSAVTVNFSRNSDLTAHTETYSLPAISTTATSGALTLYANTGQAGSVVGTASTTVKATCTSIALSSFSTATAITKVVVAPTTVTVSGTAQQLSFSATDSSSNAVVVTPGSAVFAGTGTAATVTKDGIVTPVSAGTITVTAVVDGITSAAATITVSPASTGGPMTYRVVDLGVSALQAAYNSVGANTIGRNLNDNLKCIVYDLTANDYEVVDASNPTSRTVLGGTNNQSFVLAIDNKADVLGYEYGVGAVYWSGSYSAYNIFKGTNARFPSAINASGAAVGSGLGNAFYWPSLGADAQSLPLLPDNSLDISAKDINAAGLIVGYATTNSTHTTNTAIFYSSSSAQPAILPPSGGGTDYAATSCNDSGAVVGYYNTQYGQVALMWSSTTSSPTPIGSFLPFCVNNSGVVVGASPDPSDFSGIGRLANVYTAKNGMSLLYDLCDSSRSGWKLNYATCVNTNGVIFGQGTLGGNVHMFIAIPNT